MIAHVESTLKSGDPRVANISARAIISRKEHSVWGRRTSGPDENQ